MATALTLLVDKWFYGTDPPAIDPVSVSLSASYSAVAGPLFGENANQSAEIPSSQDMRQGSVGDCYFIAALGALADSSAAAIENMFIDNGDGTWTVRFYYQDPVGGWVADYVTVNTMLPVWSNGNLVYAQPGPNGSYWLPLAEKAYAQWNETGREGRDSTNTYAALSGGCMNTVDEQVLGTVATTYSPVAGDLASEQAVIAAIESHEAVTAAIFLSGDPTVFSELGLVSCHAYVIASYDADPNSPTYDLFFLKNPWGDDDPVPLTWSQLCAYGWIAVADTSSTVPSDSTTAGATAPADADTHAAALPTVNFGQYQPDAPLVADVASNGNLHAQDTALDAHARALQLAFAEFGR